MIGQYHVVVNLDRHEYLKPHKLGCGLKLLEQANTTGGTAVALIILLACSSGRGGGDFSIPQRRPMEELMAMGTAERMREISRSDARNDDIIGRWAGDRIAIVGDYAEMGDLYNEFQADRIYDLCDEDSDDPDRYRDISDLVLPYVEVACNIRIIDDDGGGWRRIIPDGIRETINLDEPSDFTVAQYEPPEERRD